MDRQTWGRPKGCLSPPPSCLRLLALVRQDLYTHQTPSTSLLILHSSDPSLYYPSFSYTVTLVVGETPETSSPDPRLGTEGDGTKAPRFIPRAGSGHHGLHFYMSVHRQYETPLLSIGP